LTYLSLRLNQLTGAIPADLGNLTSLTFLGLNNNQVTGAIPAELGNLAGLNTLWLNGNQLTGAIPPELGNLKSLTELRLNDNRLVGAVPNSFANLSELERLTVSQNELIDLPDLSDLANLTFFQVQNNRFTFDDLEPNIGIPGFVYSPQLMFGTESTESILEGVSLTLSLSVGGSVNSYQWYKDGLPIPGANSEQYTITSAIQGDAGSYTLEVTNVNVPGLTLQSHPIVVTISVVAEDDLQALEALYNSTGGPDWTINTNWLSAEPLENWFGVSAVGGQVTELNLQSNNLTGSLPAKLDNLANLSFLDLAGNQLSGAIPAELGNLTSLTSLALGGNQLTGTIPPELGNLASLTFLGLSVNQLTGAIPAELGNLASLTSLVLSVNQLTGAIPAELGNLTSLTFLGFSVNQLTGAIPAELGNLTNLTALFLGGNQLTGAIPAELGILASLNYLNLEANQLTGAIPVELGNLKSLTELRLNDNQLDGPVPNSFANLSDLGTFNVSQNELIDLPDLSGLINLTSFQVQDNRFTFEDLEANAGIAGAVYVPQASFGTASMESLNTGDPLTLAFAVPGTANQYQWLRDDSPISGANSNEYSKSSATLADAGVYSLEVTNSLVPGLTLQSESVTVIVNEIIIDVTEPTMINASAGSDIPVSATLPDNYQPEQRELCFRRSAEPVYQCVALVRVGALDSALIPADYVTDRGVDYYFRFTRGGNVLTIPEGGAGDPFHLRVGVSEAQADGSFLPSTYRMVSVPLELENPQIEAVLDDYGPYDPTRWRIFRWDSNSQALVEHPSTSDSFTPCIAFWLITLDGSGFSVDGGTSLDPFSECGTSSFSFKPGWNQFGLPRAYPIDWEDVLKFGELDDPVNFNATIEGSDPYTYNVSTLVPWDGYWVNNPGTQDVLVTFPSVESSGTPGKQSSALAFLANSEYAIQLRASIPDRELVDEHNYLGFSKNASNGKDRMDFAEAPGIGSFVRLSLTEDDVRLAGNFKKYDLDGAAWQFEVTAEFPDGVPLNGEHVRVQILELLPRLQSQEIYIINEDEDRRVRPTAESFSVSLTRERPIVHYRIIVGTPEYAAEISDGVSLVPQSFALEQNYPNPFNPTTQIRYQLSESSHVVLEIFNSLGQRINVLVDSDQGVGWYEVTWDGRDETDQFAASGVYFYRLRAGDVSLSRPMILLR
ncbi:MAG: T9SS type A sorting domain-containing protein, partial [Bacteroidetes bacterium]|nr:T9SS type A sorting domain-containing protein [Bacteroidota bacterium]